MGFGQGALCDEVHVSRLGQTLGEHGNDGKSVVFYAESTYENGRGVTRSGLRVLVVDNNADAADALGELLSVHGSEVRIRYLAEPAIDLLGEFNADLVLLDIGLPDVDGYEACRRMRTLKGAALRIVALTGWGQNEDRRRAEEAGFDAHLTKPVDFERLVNIACSGRLDAAI